VLREAQNLQKTMHDSYIAQDHILTALLKAPSLAPVLREAGLTEATLITAIEQIRGNRRVESHAAARLRPAFTRLSSSASSIAAVPAQVLSLKSTGTTGDGSVRYSVHVALRWAKNMLAKGSTLLLVQ
jgi:ATP-dependent Clp protease ATP-binding subunit ClpB